MINSFKLSPIHIILFTLVLIGCTQLLSVHLLMQQPWIGVSFSPEADALRVDNVVDSSPLAGKISEGDVVTHLIAGDYTEIQLVPLIVINPEQIKTQQTYERYLALYDQLHRVISTGDTIRFITDEGKKVPFKPNKSTEISEIPTIYWWIVIGGVLGIAIGTFVWSYKTASLAAIFLYIGGVGAYLFTTTGAFIVVMNLGISSKLVSLLVLFLSTTLHIFMAGITCLMAIYPKVVLSNKFIYFALLYVLITIANFYFQWYIFFGHRFFMQYQPLLFLNLWCLYQQWKLTKNDPVNRSALTITMLFNFSASMVIFIFYMFPAILEKPPLINDAFARFMPTLLFLGWAIAILRYRLFEVESWWFRSWMWLLGGCLILVLDMVLIWVFNIPKLVTIEISLLIAGFLYFPLRQWLMTRMLPLEKRSLQKLLPGFSASITHARTDEEFEQRWQESLKQYLNPVNLEKVTASTQKTQLSDNGLHLNVPSIDKQQSYRLTGKNQGTRLFNYADTNMVESLLGIARLASDASKIREVTILQERERIMHDLHDTVGSQLLTLAHSVPKQHQRAAFDSLQTLRDTVKFSLRKSPLALEQHLAEWRAETVERMEAFNIALDWQVEDGLTQHSIGAKQVFGMSNFLREAVSNAVKHAKPDKISVLFSVENHLFCVKVSNNGQFTSPSSWAKGVGITSMKKRLETLGGELEIHHLETQGLIQVVALFPVKIPLYTTIS